MIRRYLAVNRFSVDRMQMRSRDRRGTDLSVQVVFNAEVTFKSLKQI